MNKTRYHLLPLLAALACGPGVDSDHDTDDARSPSEGAFLAGLWRPADGGMVFREQRLGTLDFLEFVPLEDDGSAGFLMLYGQQAQSGLQVCESALYGVGPDGFLTLFDSDIMGAEAYVVSKTEGGAVMITSQWGDTELLEAASDPLPESATCAVAEVDAIATFDLDPSTWSNLIFDGANVRVPVSDGAVAIDVDSGATGGTTAYGDSYRYLITGQGSDAWGTCACGGNQSIRRSAPGGAEVDTVDTREFEEISLSGGAWGAGHLWLYGYSQDESSYMLLQIDSEAEPDLLMSATPSALAARAITWHDGALYALVGDSVVEMSTGTGRATETWKLPAELRSLGLVGITSDGSSLYVSVRDGSYLKVARIVVP